MAGAVGNRGNPPAGRAPRSQGRPPGGKRKGARPAAHPMTSALGLAGLLCWPGLPTGWAPARAEDTDATLDGWRRQTGESLGWPRASRATTSALNFTGCCCWLGSPIANVQGAA